MWRVMTVVALVLALTACASSQAPSPTTAPPVEEAVKKYMYENFGMPGYAATWFSNISEVLVIGNEVTAETTLPRDPAGREKAGSICVALSNFVYDSQNADYGLSRVRVLAKDGSALVDRRDRSRPCEYQ